MKNLIYKYTIDNHEELNKKLLDFFDTLPTKIGDQNYNLGITKFDGHNHPSSPILPVEWQYQDTLNDYYSRESDYVPWDVEIRRYPHIEYKKIFLDAAENKLHEHAKFHMHGLEYRYNIIHMWYHQMYKSDYTHWENHQWCQWSGIYFVEIPDQRYITKFKTIQPKAKAGDMLIFPSWLLHRAPKMETNERRTVISWNMDVGCILLDSQIKALKLTHPSNWKYK